MVASEEMEIKPLAVEEVAEEEVTEMKIDLLDPLEVAPEEEAEVAVEVAEVVEEMMESVEIKLLKKIDLTRNSMNIGKRVDSKNMLTKT